MKTSNKLLLGMFVAILVSITTFFSLAKIYSVEHNGNAPHVIEAPAPPAPPAAPEAPRL